MMDPRHLDGFVVEMGSIRKRDPIVVIIYYIDIVFAVSTVSRLNDIVFY
jgi:hypothetical protein